MWFTRVSIGNPVLATMVMLAFVVLGLFSYQRLSVDQFPNVDFPTVVVVMGPQRPFLADESAAINRFMARPGGGRLLVALDPENHVTMKEVLDPLQLEYHDVMLANDQAYVRHTHTDADRTNLVTATFSSHPSVTTLLRLGTRAPTIFLGSGWVDAKRGRPIEIQVDAPIKAHFATFVDKNNNFQFDGDEQRRAWEISGAVSKGLMRAFVVADSDCFADEAISAPGNELLTLDVMHWLMGDEAYQGLVSSEMDLPVTHTRKQDVAWFYSTIFLAPAMVLGLGWVTTKRRRKDKDKDRDDKDTDAPPPSPPRSAPGSDGGAS